MHLSEYVTLTSAVCKTRTTVAYHALGSMSGGEYEFAHGQYLVIFDTRASGDLLYVSKSPFLPRQYKYRRSDD